MESVKKYISRSLKNKVRITMSLICVLLMTNAVQGRDTNTEIENLKQQFEEFKKQIKIQNGDHGHIKIGDKFEGESADSILFGIDIKNQQRGIVFGKGIVNESLTSTIFGQDIKILKDEMNYNNFIRILALGSSINVKSMQYANVMGYNINTESSNSASIYGSNLNVTTSSNSTVLGNKIKLKKGAGSTVIGTEINTNKETEADGSVIIGKKVETDGKVIGAVLIGTDSGMKANGSSWKNTKGKGNAITAIGSGAQALANKATALGFRTEASGDSSIAIGSLAKTTIDSGVAVGSYALSDRKTLGTYYDFFNDTKDETKKEAYKETYKQENINDDITKDMAKLATKSAFSIGNTSKGYTRQLIGLAAGSEDTDAVNVWQLKQLRDYVVSSQPFEYADKEGNKVVAVKDDKGNIKYYKYKNNKPDTTQEVKVEDLAVRAKGDKPKTLDNIDSGLGLAKDETKDDVIAKVLSGETKNNKAVNVADLSKVAKGLVEKGLNFTGDDENTVVNRKLGDTLKIKGGKTSDLTDSNIGVVADKDDGTLNIKLSSKLSNLSEIKFSGDGAPTLSSTGINMGNKKITQVLDGSDDGDAVNFKQLKNSLDKALEKATEISKVTITQNSPMMFAKKDKDGNLKPIVKANDGKFYSPSDVKADGSKNDNAQEVTVGEGEEIVIKTIDPQGTDPSKDMKLTKIASGDISTNSTDAINGGQLAKILGIDGTNYKVDKDGNVVKKDNKPIYSAINYKESSKNTPNGLIDATNELITAVNKGYVIKADDNKSITKQLGETISIIHGDDNKVTDFAGKNIKTYLTENGDVALLFSEKPIFKSVTIENAPIKDTDATNKKYVDGELNTIKSALGDNVTKLKELSDNSPFEYEYTDENGEKLKAIEKDGVTKYYKESDIENGKAKDDAQAVEDAKVKKSIKAKDDPKQISNVASGLGLKEDDKKTIKEKLDKLLGNVENKEDQPLDRVATIKDLQALGQFGMIFAGNDEKEVHRNLGQTLNIKGVGIEKDKVSEFKSSNGNILVKENKEENPDGLVIALSKKLKDLEDAIFEKKNEKGDKTSTTTINGDGITLKDKDDKNVIEIKNNGGKGEINFAKDNGKGTGKITGLADLDDKSTGDMAANKNYVDKKIQELDSNNPFSYEDKDGNKVVKGEDGKLYKESDIKDKKYDKDKGYTDNKGNKIEPKKNSEIVLTAQPKNEGPIKLGNIDSGIFKEKKIAKDDATDEEKKKIDEENKKAEDETIKKVLKGENTDKTVINAEDLSKISKAIMNKGLTFKAKDGEEIHKNLGETLEFEGDKNITVTSKKDGNIIVGLNKDINVDSVTTGNSTLNSDGLTFSDNNGKITGLADIKDNDPRDVAVNKGYVDDKLGVVDKKADTALGGVSNAVAMANLVQVSSNSTHRHNLSAAYGYYGGSHSLAIGFSGISKNNNFIYKLSGAVNNQGNLALGIGAGIMLGEKNDYKERKHTILLEKELKEVKAKLENSNNELTNYKKETDKKIKELELIIKKLIKK